MSSDFVARELVNLDASLTQDNNQTFPMITK